MAKLFEVETSANQFEAEKFITKHGYSQVHRTQRHAVYHHPEDGHVISIDHSSGKWVVSLCKKSGSVQGMGYSQLAKELKNLHG